LYILQKGKSRTTQKTENLHLQIYDIVKLSAIQIVNNLLFLVVINKRFTNVIFRQLCIFKYTFKTA